MSSNVNPRPSDKVGSRRETVRAPEDGCVTNLTLHKGARVVPLPLASEIAFFDMLETIAVVEAPQIYARYVKPGQLAETAFKFLPGQHSER
jgi:multidrug resistance efflux pump